MCSLFFGNPVSRVLFKTVICLDRQLPADSSHLPGTAGPAICPSAVLLRIEFTALTCLHAMSELLPHFSTLTDCKSAVYLCCTCPRVSPGGRYPLSLPCGARTFLTYQLSPDTRDRSDCHSDFNNESVDSQYFCCRILMFENRIRWSGNNGS